MSTIAVSGCGGYVGNVLIRHLLSEGHRVRGMDNFHKGHCDSLFSVANHPRFDFLYGDVTKVTDCDKLVKGVDGIVHLAAIVGFPACARQPALSAAVNVSGAANMIEARNRVSTNIPFVFASTGSVYGKITELCTEAVSTNPQSQYGLDKLNAEIIVRDNKNTISLRFATGFGISPCMRVNLLVNDLVYQAITNKCFTLFEAEAKRTFIHVYDMARAFVWGLNSVDNSENVFNCGDKRLNWSKRQLAEYIKSKTGCYVTYADVGKDADARDYEVSYDKINKLGFECVKTMEEGIDELIKVTPILKIRHQYE
jgi:nucleoside-diphosphate-sugar epimerase